MTSVDERKRREAEFHDHLRKGHLEQRWSVEAEKRIADNLEWSNFKWYSIERKSLDYVRDWLKQRCGGKRVLDYCCGNGTESIFLAKQGAREVVGIDISEESIYNCRQQATALGLDAIARFEVMDAEVMNFPDNSFDLMSEYGCLHHLDLGNALPELARVLKPGGSMICAEVLGHNRFIQWYRCATPHLRTAWETEHIIRRSDLRKAAQYFDGVDIKCFHLATLAAVPFRKTAVFQALLRVLEGIDEVLLRIPLLKWQAWMVVFVLDRPKK